jgi:hypothetical protein
MVRVVLILHVAALIMAAQAQRPPGLVRGVVTVNTAEMLAVRTTGGATYEYRTDAKTWIERDHERIRASSLQPGENLEVVSDRDPEPIRYARVIHVIEPVRTKPLPVSTGGVYRLKPAPAPESVVYAGLVVAREHDHFVLRTRFDGDQTIYLRADTQCLKDGDLVDLRAIVPPMRVNVVATRNAERELVADRVIWGALLEPQP